MKRGVGSVSSAALDWLDSFQTSKYSSCNPMARCYNIFQSILAENLEEIADALEESVETIESLIKEYHLV